MISHSNWTATWLQSSHKARIVLCSHARHFATSPSTECSHAHESDHVHSLCQVSTRFLTQVIACINSMGEQSYVAIFAAEHTEDFALECNIYFMIYTKWNKTCVKMKKNLVKKTKVFKTQFPIHAQINFKT